MEKKGVEYWPVSKEEGVWAWYEHGLTCVYRDPPCDCCDRLPEILGMTTGRRPEFKPLW